MTGIKVRLIKAVGRDGGPFVRLQYDALLSHPPAPWYSIGLYPDSEFNQDELVVERAMYLADSDSWLAEVRGVTFGNGERDFVRLVKSWTDSGWRLHLDMPLTEPDDAIHLDVRQDESIIECRCGLWLVDQTDMAILNISGELYKLIPPTAALPQE